MSTDKRSRPLAATLRRPTPAQVQSSKIGGYLGWLRKRNENAHFDDYNALWQWSVDNLADFWGSIWDYFEVIAATDADVVLTGNDMPGARWFDGATLNYAENALSGADSEVAIIAVSQTRPRIEITRAELRDQVARARAGLERVGVKPGDRVAGYLPNIPEAVVAMLATVSLGAIWSACAPEFGTQTVLDRFRQIEPTVLIAVDGYRYGQKDIDRRAAVAEIGDGLPSLRVTVGVNYLLDDPCTFAGVPWAALTAEPAEPKYLAVPFSHPLWILFSSGTTGLPKAITHSHGGITLEQLKSHALQSDMGRGDRYFVYCTTSWVMWNILVSALLVKAAIVLMDGNPGYPDSATLWRIAAGEKVTAFGCGASVIVQAARQGVIPNKEFDLSALRSVSSTGSPLPAEAFEWIYANVGSDIYLQSSSGGTDICGAFVGGSPMLPVRAGEISGRCLGVDVSAVDPDGADLIDTPGELVVSSPMPSMPIYFWNDPDGSRYGDAYFDVYPGRWRHGDWIVMHEDGSNIILGRSDGTLNRGGVRLGSAELYGVIDRRPDIDDSLVVHLEDPRGGLGQLLLFVQLPEGRELDDELTASISTDLRVALSPRHVPDEIIRVPAIPYGLTGKKLEIPVKRILLGHPRSEIVSDGAMRDPSALDAFEALTAKFQRESIA